MTPIPSRRPHRALRALVTAVPQAAVSLLARATLAACITAAVPALALAQTPTQTPAQDAANSAAAPSASAVGTASTVADALVATPSASAAASAAEAPAKRQVFIVFDAVMEATALEGPAADAARAHLQRGFDALLPLLQAWGRQHRVGIDAALFLERRKIDLKEGVYSHLLIEKLTREARSDGPEGARFSERRWSAQGFAIHSDRARAPRALGNEHYSSEALSCFAAPAPDSAAAACRHAYLDKLSAHLRWIDPALGTLQASAR